MSGAKVWVRSPTPELAIPFDYPILSPSTGCPVLTIRTPEAIDSSSSRLPKDLTVLQRPTRHRISRHQTAFVAQIEQSIPVPIFPMCQTASTELIKTVIKQAVPNVKVESIHALPCDHLQRAFSVKVSDGRTLMLTQSPSPTLRLLRSEQWLVATNYLVVRWLLTAGFDNPVSDGEAPLDKSDIANRITGRSAKGKQPARIQPVHSLKDIVLPYIPTLVSDSPSTSNLGSAFHLFEPARGVPISKLQKRLTAPERKVVDFQVGRLIRRLSELTSPNGTFGPAVAVIGPQQSSQHRETPQAAVGSGGTGSWTNAFHSLLEGILRDGEDMAVTISYALIRKHFRRLAHLLDAVTVARLVVLNAGDDDNVLVSDATRENHEGSRDKRTGQRTQSSGGKTAESGRDLPQKKTQPFPPGKKTASYEAAPAASSSATPQHPGITVTGLWDWSNTVFGDPLFATIFSRETSAELLGGFRQSPLYYSDTDEGGKEEQEHRAGRSSGDAADEDDYIDDDIIEDRDNAPIRLLLYECYHATASVVRQFYRPGQDSSARELAARRRLAAVLARLGDVQEAAVGKRPRRASGDAWPDAWPPRTSASVPVAKKFKVDAESNR